MIINDLDDVKTKEFLGQGRYGTVYKLDDNIAIKLYKEQGYYMYGRIQIYKIPKTKFKLLKMKQKNIKNTDLVRDIVYHKGETVGALFDYYDGDVLADIMDKDMDEKKEIALSLLDNAKELTDNGIYPTDYKLDNVMYSNGKVKIIDLDDKLTHVSLFNISTVKCYSMMSLSNTVRIFLGDDTRKSELSRKVFIKYDDIKEYIKKR